MADDVKRVEGNYTQQWKSIHSDLIRKYYLPDIYKTYGRGFDFLDFFTMIGKKGLAPSPTVRFWEKGHIKSNITLSAAIATGAVGAQIAIKISAGDYDSNNNPVLRDGQIVFIPQKYQPAAINIPQSYQVISHSGTAGDVTWVAKPFNNAVAQIAVEIPIGTTLSLGQIPFARGTGLPTGTTQSYLERSFQSTILKERFGIEGGFLSETYWQPLEINGKFSGYINPMLYETEFLLDDQINNYAFLGQTNDNSTIVQTSHWGGSNKVLSGDGIWQMLEDRGQKLTYAGNFENADYVAAKNLFEAQGVMDNEIIFAMGSALMDDTDQGDLDFLKEYSGGSDLLRNMTELGFQATTVNRSGIRFQKVKLKGFSNPFGLGNAEYDLTHAGFMMPTSKAKVSASADGSKPMMFNNIELRFLGNGQEDRTRVIGHLNGISGIRDAAPVHEYDGLDVGMLTEPILLFTNVNQCVQVLKEA